MTLCFSKVYQPGKLTLSSCLRHCSSISRPQTSEKPEPGGSTVLKETSHHSVSLSIPPVLFIAKYNRLIETSDFGKAIPHPKDNSETFQKPQNELDDRLEANNW